MRIISQITLIAVCTMFLSTGCGDSTTSPVITFETPAGTDITLEYPDGSTESVTGDRVIGWQRSKLLEGNYSRQVQGFTNKGTILFRLSVPKNMTFADIVGGTHALRQSRLLLQDTGVFLNEVQAEFFFQTGDEFDGLENMNGTVTIEQDINFDDETYDLQGEVEGELVNIEGDVVKITGTFWSKDLE